MDHIEKQLIETLKSLRNDPDFGASLDYEGIHRRAMIRNGFDPDAIQHRYTVRDYVETYLWMFTHSLLKPMAAAMAVFVFAIAGSISIAGASGQALPGEKLYPVKIGMEQAQLALAFSDEQRAQLRVEFVSRRLEEMVEVAATLNKSGSSEDVQLAVNRFKSEVENIQEELHGEDATTQKEFAKAVGRKVEVYSSVTDSSTDLSEEVRGEVAEILEDTKDQVVEVIISAHEVEQDEEGAAELDEALASEMLAVSQAYGEAAEEAIRTAEALREEGLYRRAFQVLKDFTFEAELELGSSVSDEVEIEPSLQE
jgi:hypothetical protein